MLMMLGERSQLAKLGIHRGRHGRAQSLGPSLGQRLHDNLQRSSIEESTGGCGCAVTESPEGACSRSCGQPGPNYRGGQNRVRMPLSEAAGEAGQATFIARVEGLQRAKEVIRVWGKANRAHGLH